MMIAQTGRIQGTGYQGNAERRKREAGHFGPAERPDELFYCLETSIRDLIRARLIEADKDNWWERFVVQFIRDNASANKKKETESGVTPRSDDWLSYTNFGELGQIIANNWDLFSDMFSDPKAVRDTITRLNTLRAPIAHCSMLAEDEVLRLKLSLRDWFRLME
jgi:hypothetical protein